ncbi:hypothetical protein KKF91_14290 [Myxococcota bacterium]|nr:hypothetical protein [Myxococcota bacterium]MBU1431710.1 hypothetical protein [Myxococcota bacterium]MBU1900706.1 hypothetical protein [Myxococcota bacterium]
MRRLPALGLLALASTTPSCGPERDLSGVWQQICAEEDAACLAAPYRYELHLGRYGDDLSGLMIRYVNLGVGGDSFQKPLECGCFFLQGGRADGDALYFSLFQPDAPGAPEHPSEDCPRVPGEGCAGFALRGEGDLLVGERRCEQGQSQAITFEPGRGSPRTRCGQQ